MEMLRHFILLKIRKQPEMLKQLVSGFYFSFILYVLVGDIKPFYFSFISHVRVSQIKLTERCK